MQLEPGWPNMSNKPIEFPSWKCPVCKIDVVAVNDKALQVAITYHMLEHLYENSDKWEENE